MGALYKLYQEPTTKKMGSIDESTKDLKSALIFDGIAEALENDGANLVKKVKGIFGFKIKDTAGKEHLWIVDAKNGSGKVEFNGKVKPDVTLSLKDADLVDLMTGKLNPQKAFFQGKLKVQGNMGLAMKLQEFQKKNPTKAKLLTLYL